MQGLAPGMAELLACRVCGGHVGAAFEARERMLGTREAFPYVECLECGCLQIAAVPADSDRFYPAKYPDFRHARRRAAEDGSGRAAEDDSSRMAEDGAGRTADSGFRRFVARAADAIRRGWTRGRLAVAAHTGLRIGKRYGGYDWFARTATGLDDPILDVGCGAGRLVLRMARAGFTRLTGIDERLPEERRDAGSPRLLRESLERHDGRYRLVMAHHSFEHMRDPQRAFRALAERVVPGGWLVLRLPRADSAARWIYGADWVQLDAPRHLHLHTRASLERLASSSDLELVSEVDDSGPFQIWGSELYRRDIALAEAGPGARSIFGPWACLRFRWRAGRLRRAGLGDQACFYFRRVRGGRTAWGDRKSVDDQRTDGADPGATTTT